MWNGMKLLIAPLRIATLKILFRKCTCMQSFYLAVIMHFVVTHELLRHGAADWFSD